MHWTRDTRCTAFAGNRQLASGTLEEVAAALQAAQDAGETEPMLCFADATSELIEIDLRGTPEEIVSRIAPAAATGRGPGRPKLGVVAKEVTLLPRHWQWLSEQPGGASVALRKLVEHASRECRSAEQIRHAKEATYRFMTALAGNLPGYEEATRALFAGDAATFTTLTASWPVAIRDYAGKLATSAFAREPDDTGESPCA